MPLIAGEEPRTMKKNIPEPAMTTGIDGNAAITKSAAAPAARARAPPLLRSKKK